MTARRFRNIGSIVAVFVGALFGIACDSSASITIQNKTAGWGDYSNANVNGMSWGIIIGKGAADDFSGSFITDISSALVGFDPFGPAPGVSTPVQIGSTNYYFAEAQSLTTSSGPPSFTNGYMNTDQFNLISGTIDAGDHFGVMWFPTGGSVLASGDHFGFQTNASWILPSDGATSPISPSAVPGLASYTVGVSAVPEPSSFLALAGLGFFGFVGRRVRRPAVKA